MTRTDLINLLPRTVYYEKTNETSYYHLVYVLNDGSTAHLSLSIDTRKDTLKKLISKVDSGAELPLNTIEGFANKLRKIIIADNNTVGYSVADGRDAYKLYVTSKISSESEIYVRRPTMYFDMLREWYEQELKNYRTKNQDVNSSERGKLFVESDFIHEELKRINIQQYELRPYNVNNPIEKNANTQYKAFLNTKAATLNHKLILVGVEKDVRESVQDELAKELVPDIEREQPKSEQIKLNLIKYNIDKFLEAQQFSEKQIISIIKLLLNADIPYSIALLNAIGYLDYFKNEYCENKTTIRDKLLGNVLNATPRRIKGNINVLVNTSKEDKATYTSHIHGDEIKKLLKNL